MCNNFLNHHHKENLLNSMQATVTTKGIVVGEIMNKKDNSSSEQWRDFWIIVDYLKVKHMINEMFQAHKNL